VTRRLLVVSAALGRILVAPAHATDHPLEARRVVLERRPSTGRESLVWVTKVPAVGLPSASPTSGGATLRVSAASGEGASLTLPAAGWSANADGTVFRFTSKRAPSKVKLAVLKEAGILKVTARATGISLDEPSQGTVSVRLAIGTDVYCATCTAPLRDEPGAYQSRECAAPAACGPPFCGDSQVNQPSEQCDGSDPGVCDDYPVPFPAACDAPGAPHECQCCWTESCVYSSYLGGPPAVCCGAGTCVNRTAVGSVRFGACVPPSCSEAADCNGLDCVGGACCARPGEVCDNIACCPGSGAGCRSVPFAGSLICCLPVGASCTEATECCSGSCGASQCD
jgi:hypothetical protein